MFSPNCVKRYVSIYCLDVEKVVRFGRASTGKQRYLCRQETCKKEIGEKNYIFFKVRENA